MKFKILGLMLILSSLYLGNVQGQTVKAMTVQEFESIIPRDADTLYVLNFWATWCGPCVEELPYFIKLDSMTQDKPVKVVLVSLDFAGQKEKQLIPFLQEKNIQTEVWYLTDAHGRTAKGWIDRVSPAWSGAIPATLLVGGGNKTYAFKEATFTWESLISWVTPYFP